MLLLADYSIAEQIYDGAYSQVYRGYRNADRAPVTIKALKSEYPGPSEVARLNREYAILRSLNLPGVAAVYALETVGTTWALILEHLKGESLIQIMRRRRLELAEVLHIAIAVTSTLDALHRKRIVHRDVKPHNIVLDVETYSVHLIDFGSAMHLSADREVTEPPEAMEGTLVYMAPEQSGRMNRRVDTRSDLYALGVSLYEMLTGAVPFGSTDAVELIHSHLTRTPPAPHKVAPAIPELISELVMKLLAKAPEERYQTAFGLNADLKECLRRWQSTGEITPFALGSQDRPDELRLPRKLYGRQKEESVLLAAFERTSRGAAELLLLSGDSGTGKTALIAEIQQPVLTRGAYLCAGKFDQLSRCAPYSGLAQALRSLIDKLLAESSAVLAGWARKLQAALGNSGALLTEIIPDLTLIIGPQPAVPPLGPVQSQNRFNLVFQSFLRVFANADHPLVLFLDDLQWADVASLKLLQGLLADPQRGYLLIIGAYRDFDQEASQTFLEPLRELRKLDIRLSEIKLEALGLPDVIAIIAATLGLEHEPNQVEPLAQLVFEKTQGNPFFVRQFLEHLHAESLLRFELSLGRWSWSLAGIANLQVTDNVVELMTRQLRRQPPVPQQLLELSACIGYEFELRMLSTLADKSLAETAIALWPTIQEGLIVPLDGGPRLRALLEGGVGAAADAATHASSYRFVHDRVQQAAYSLLSSDIKQQTHLRIGQILQRQHAAEDPPFAVVDHLNLGAAMLGDPQARLELARMNLAAGQRAKSATAYAAAADYFRAGIMQLDAGWDTAFDLCYALHLKLAECEFLNGQFEHSESLFTILTSRSRSDIERGHICTQRARAFNNAGRFADAIRVGLEGLALFGLHLPSDVEGQVAAFQTALVEVNENLNGRTIEDVLAMDKPLDQAQAWTIELITVLIIVSFVGEPNLYRLMIVTGVNYSLKHGHSNLSAMAYVTYGSMLTNFFARYEEGRKFGQLALDLDKKFSNIRLSSRMLTIFGTYNHFYKPLRESFFYFDEAYRTGLESGDFVALSLSRHYLISYKLSLGYELDALRAENDTALDFAQQVTKDTFATSMLRYDRQLIANLQGQTTSPASLSSADFDEDAAVARQQANHAVPLLTWHSMIKVQLLCLYEDHAGLPNAVADADLWSKAFPGLFWATTQSSFWICLALLALPDDAEEGAEERRQILARHRRKLEEGAEIFPQNYRHLQLLIAAEAARVSHRSGDALSLYEQAIDAARDNKFVYHGAIANELCAKFLIARGRLNMASVYLKEAHYSFRQLSAHRKVALLEAQHASLLAADRPIVEDVSLTQSGAGASRRRSDRLLDVSTVLRAAQAIASEIMLDKVLDQLMRIVLTNAGAQRGVLLAESSGQLTISASMRVDPDEIAVGLHVPLAGSDALPESVAQYVARTQEMVVIGNAATDSRWSSDPYLVAHKPKSILCMALLHQGRLAAILYLENSAAYEAFPVHRIEILRLLSAQAAIAMENARLYRYTQEVRAKLERANEALELQVGQRTAALEAATEELRQSNQRLQAELVERERAEQARAALQEEIIRVQSTRLAEMSTPLIPITDRIMVLPIIGTMDSDRAQQMLEMVLIGAQSRRARVVIIDITGMTHMDTAVASTLLNISTALRLLGAQSVLTGIRAEVAQMLVQLGVDLKGIVTHSTLQSGIAYAIGQSGEARLFSTEKNKK